MLGAPSAAAVLAWGYSVRSNNPAKAAQAALQPVGRTGRRLLEAIDSTTMNPEARRALEAHRDVLREQLRLSRSAVEYKRLFTLGAAIMLVILGLVLFLLSVFLSRNLARQLSSPIDELVGWTGRIQRNEPLPMEPPRPGAPEFAALRTALREMAVTLQHARRSELESERLRAFREVARRVAHEMKNPLTPIRFAVASLGRAANKEQEEALEVLRAESARLEQLARDFANLGRLPEGPPAPVDLGELLGELIRTSLPPEIEAHLQVSPNTPHIVGHYDSLRRAVSNVLRNAVEAMDGIGRIEATIRPWEGGVRISVADQGPGIALAKRSRIFEPYFTEKVDGTGLGLAIVKQAIDLHQGTIEVVETPGGGATFVIWLPPGQDKARTRPPEQPVVERRVADRRRTEG